MVMTKNTAPFLLVCILAVAAFAACDRDPLLAPVASTISITAKTTTLRPGESTELTAIVIEEAGTPVHDGTLVRFSATLGSVEPEQAKTDDGIARATFTAGSALGTARIVAISGAAEPGTDIPNTIDIVIAN
jgi:hypothetical protein